ncbi:hypothetical protein MCP1_430015 [Candidatus Terasakiella magnetica]|nr:hypothetical protein MCP1_430015 [Candidatus Terasakiella magnetica]
MAFFAVDLDTTAEGFNNPVADVKPSPFGLPRSPNLPFYEASDDYRISGLTDVRKQRVWPRPWRCSRAAVRRHG